MRLFCVTALKLIAAAVMALHLGGCASTAPADSSRAARDEKGQTELEGMENAVLKDNNPDTPARAKPPN